MYPAVAMTGCPVGIAEASPCFDTGFVTTAPAQAVTP